MSSSLSLRLHAFLPCSRTNGPGARAVLWTQGCSLGCPGCFNPQTHAVAGGEVVLVSELLQRVVRLGSAIEGVTLSGGEPLQQPAAVAEFLARLRAETHLSVLLFTGYTWAEVRARPDSDHWRAGVDVVLAGRYGAAPPGARGPRGLAHKTLHFLTPRYTRADLEAVPEAEIFIGADGEISTSGLGPLLL